MFNNSILQIVYILLILIMKITNNSFYNFCRIQLWKKKMYIL